MKKSYWGALLALLLVGTMLFGCVAATAAPAGSGSRVGRSGSSDTSTTGAGATAEADTTAMAQASNELNWKLYNELFSDKDNTFYSSYSIESCFAMMDAGAKNNTKKQMEQVLGIKDIDTFLQQYNAYRSKDRADTCKLNVANGLWINTNKLDKKSVNQQYIANMQKYMGAKVKAEPFTAATGREITAFVNQATEGFMPDYKSIVKDSNAMDLLNAIYFDGKWRTPFSPDDTYKQDFYGTKKTKKTDMMHLYGKRFQYYEGQQFRAVNLPYKGDMVMTLILPTGSNNKGVASSWKKLSAKDKDAFLDSLDKSGSKKITELALPKFKDDITETRLPDVMQKLGMTDAFTGRADFSGIANSLCIENVNHRAKVEVNEQGTKAAAVTEANMMMTSAAPVREEIINFICDHPFLYLIRDRTNGLVLFTGVMNQI